MELSTAYVAGLFDGEGCFVITKATNVTKSRRRDFYYTAQAAIEIREEFIVDALIAKYGGNKTYKQGKKEAHSDTFRWKVGAANLKGFCLDAMNDLLIKRQQAVIVLQFLEVREGKTSSKITDAEIEQQELLREKIMTLNQKGTGDIQHRQLIPNNVAPRRKGK